MVAIKSGGFFKLMIICPEHLELIPKGKVIMASKMSEHLDIDKAYYRLSFETFMFLYFL